MEITFWGTRGSIPAPGPSTLEFGGNTTCVEILLDSGLRLVIDGGTGFRLLGQKIIQQGGPTSFHLLLTHGHWDHLLGIPFFIPIYAPDTEILVDGWPPAFHAMSRVFDSHMGDGFFPVAFDQLKARIQYLNRLAQGRLEVGGALIDSIRLNHPQGGLGFRIKEGAATLVFLTDNELGAAQGSRVPEFVEFVSGCDLLIHDAQYLPGDFPRCRGWGHSSFEEAVAMARQAGVRNLVLTHHDPSRTDVEVQDIVEQARQLAQARGPEFIDAAREGACYRLP